jgi:hypothetical protein
MPGWLVPIWTRAQGWMAEAALVLGAIVSAWVVGRRSGGDRVRAQAAASEQNARRDGDAAARTAERDGADKRLRRGDF